MKLNLPSSGPPLTAGAFFFLTIQITAEIRHFCVYPQGALRKNDHLHVQTHIFRLELTDFSNNLKRYLFTLVPMLRVGIHTAIKP